LADARGTPVENHCIRQNASRAESADCSDGPTDRCWKCFETKLKEATLTDMKSVKQGCYEGQPSKLTVQLKAMFCL